MNPESTAHKIDTRYGVLYLAVAPARMTRHYDVGQGMDVTELTPRIGVASDAAFTADPDAADHWTIRGRAYAVHKVYCFKDLTHVEYSDGRHGDRWHAEDAPHRGGYRNSKRQPVEFRTTTYNLMDNTVLAALDSFAVDWPEWAVFSEYLYLTSREEAARSEARRLEAEYRKTVAEANDYTAQADGVAAALPDKYFTPPA